MGLRAFCTAVSTAALLGGAALGQPYLAAPEVIAAGEGAGGDSITGVVFEDLNRDGSRQIGEPGIAGVLVSNGREVVETDGAGAYRIAVRPDMDLTVVQPAGWRVPTDARQVPQFFYTHKPGGTPETLRYGGLPDTGPAPAQVNFPLIRSEVGEAFSCAVLGDTQTYSNTEVGYFRDSAIADLINAAEGPDCLLYVGDVMGDDLGLLDRLLEIGAAAGAPQWLVHGNHDFDFDASSDEHSADSWRQIYGPNYYAFEMGAATFIVLDNVVYPCGPEDLARPNREFCGPDERTTYNGRVTDVQMQWLENLLARIPEDRLIVFAHHIPFVSFVDAQTTKHQTDNLLDIYALVEGREALSLSGHTHTIENHAPGQVFEGWRAATGVSALPFRHIVAGAASGAWWRGDFGVDGTPMSLQRQGAPKGVLMLDFNGTAYREDYNGSGLDPALGQWVSFNTPAFRDWFETIMAWRAEDRETRDPIPPLSINDLADVRILTPGELAQGVWITANVWAGSAETAVTVSINGGAPFALARTQAGAGEAALIGADWADPFAVQRQLTVARYAIQSRSGEPRNQGFEAYQGASFGPGAPQPAGSIADRSMHLWRAQLPADLPLGVHTAEVVSTDRHGRETVTRVIFEVRAERPAPRWRDEL